MRQRRRVSKATAIRRAAAARPRPVRATAEASTARVVAVVVRSVIVIGQTCPVAVEFVVSSAADPRTSLTTKRAPSSDAAPDHFGCVPFPEGTICRERSRAMSVTSHLTLRLADTGHVGRRRGPGKGGVAPSSVGIQTAHHDQTLFALGVLGATRGKRVPSQAWRLRMARQDKQVPEGAQGTTVARVEWQALPRELNQKRHGRGQPD